MHPTFLTAMMLSLLAPMAQADLFVTFRDGAPKDRFTLINIGSCASGPMDVTLDLSPAPAGLIFDVTAQGSGVEVYQPFELTSGADAVRGISDVADGDQRLTMALNGLAPGDEVSFTIDLDDTGGAREITVSGAEIAGALVQVTITDTILTGTFDATGAARVPFEACTS